VLGEEVLLEKMTPQKILEGREGCACFDGDWELFNSHGK